MHSYRDSFQIGLSSLRNQRRLFEIFVQSVLDDLGREISGMLLNEVVFQWRRDVLGAYCPHTGVGRYFARLMLLDSRDAGGRWEPVLRLILTDAVVGERRWEVSSRKLVEDTFSGMVACPSVARDLARLGGLRTEDRSEFADIVLPLKEELT
jgi:hypothetical protein